MSIARSTPINKWILVERDEGNAVSDGGIVLPDSVVAETRPFKGTVISRGEGKMIEIDGKLEREPRTVEPGDRVLYRKYMGVEFEENKKNYIFLEQDEILAIL